MSATLELIKAKQNAIKAEEDVKVANAKRDFEIMTQALDPLVKVIEEAKNLPTHDRARGYMSSLNPEAPRTVGAFIDERDLRGSLTIMLLENGRLNHCFVRAPKISITGQGSITTDSAGKLFISTIDGASSRQEAMDWLITVIARLVK
jgi:hypothetical protein